MLTKPLHDVTPADLQALLESRVPEKRTLDYKREPPARNDAGKKELVSDIVSFANAAGGDIIFGVEEAKDEGGQKLGFPAALPGLDGSMDELKLWITNVARDNVVPRVPGLDLVAIEGFDRGPILILRIPRSWAGPHMNTVSRGTRFFSRTSAGKYEFDVAELRSAFLRSAELGDRVRAVRDQRLGRLLANDLAVQLTSGPRLALHLIAFSSLEDITRFDLQRLDREYGDLQPIGTGGIINHRFNADGYVTSSGKPGVPQRQYVQALRNGVLEYVHADFARDKVKKVFNVPWLEEALVAAVKAGLALQRKHLIPLPVVALLTFVGMKDYEIASPSGYGDHDEPARIDRDILLLPDVLIESWDTDLHVALKPAFDVLWQSSGWPRSFSYDDAGLWRNDMRRS